MRAVPEAFNRRLALTFGAGYVMRWDDTVKRYALDSPTATGGTVTQWWGWFRDAKGQPIEADFETGLHPFRDLDQTAQDEIVRNLQRSYIGQTGDGRTDWARHAAERRQFNDALVRQRQKARAQTFADVLAEVDLRRPWLKHHRPVKARPVIEGGA